MNTKPNEPEELKKLGKVHGWLFAAMLTACATYILLHGNIFKGWHLHEEDWPILSGLQHHHGEDWPVVVRIIVELLPMFMSLIWARDVARRIRGMDELHRRIMLETCLFSICGTFFFITTWNRLQNTDVLRTIFRHPLRRLLLRFGLSVGTGIVWPIWISAIFH